MSHPLSFYAFFLYTTSSTYYLLRIFVSHKGHFLGQILPSAVPVHRVGTDYLDARTCASPFRYAVFFPHVEDYVIQLTYLEGMMIHSMDFVYCLITPHKYHIIIS